MRPEPSSVISFREALRVWAEIGLNSFGGPAGQIAVMHRVLVEERKWVSERRFLHALNYCMLLPGPEAQQLATYIGWLLHGYRGGVVAGVFFVVPGFVAILALSVLYVSAADVRLVAALLFGLKAAVLAVVAEAVVRIGRRVLRTPAHTALAAMAFVALFFFDLPFPMVIATAAAIGLVGSALAPELLALSPGGRHPSADDGVIDAILERGADAHVDTSLARLLRVLAVWLGLWLAPIAVLWAWRGRGDVFVEQALFFGKAAVVTFGGAYAVLAYIAQQAVQHYHWLAPGEMLDGLGMAETTPGPLIMVVQFVAFLGAYRAPLGIDPLIAGVLGSILTIWVTFIPCFLWIFAGAPWVERLRGDERLAGALSAISASVVGVILNLGLWLALHVLFGEVRSVSGPLGLRLLVPDVTNLDVAATVLAIGALVALIRFRVRIPPTLLACAAAGAVYRLWIAPRS
jgi:chromate transporter